MNTFSKNIEPNFQILWLHYLAGMGSTLYRDCYGSFALYWHYSKSTQIDFINIKVEYILKANDIWKKSRKSCKTGVTLVISTFTVVSRWYHDLLLLPVEEQYLDI